jgi:hypothetical protein
MKLCSALIALAVVASLSASSPSNALAGGAPNTCSYGMCFGEWNTPGNGNGNTSTATFTRADGSTVVFNVAAHTHTLPQPDPQHEAGVYHGFLFYGPPVGTPDFVFYGHWEKEIATGRGHFYAPIYTPDNVLVLSTGRLGGTFFEPPGDPTPFMGSFVGTWGLQL